MTDQKTSRDKVLALLESNKGSYLSGEEIASDVGISRTAVWKAVKKLQESGYVIDAVTNRGYCLVRGSDVLSEGKIRSFLQPDSPGIAMDVFDTVDSTNTVCLQRVSSMHCSAPYAAIAGCQTQGRGRRGRSFFSPDGTGLYMSILLRPSALSANQAMRFTTIAAVATAEAIEAISGRSASIKWVNDIYVGGRKVCGILTEASFNPEDGTLDYAVVGIGINVYEPAGGFPEDIRDRAGAITSSGAGSHAVSSEELICSPETIMDQGGRNRLAAEILGRFFSYCSEVRSSGSSILNDVTVPAYVSEYRRRCFVTGMDVDVLRAGSDPVKAHVLGIDDQCHLMVRYEDGSEETLSSGEISIRI